MCGNRVIFLKAIWNKGGNLQSFLSVSDRVSVWFSAQMATLLTALQKKEEKDEKPECYATADRLSINREGDLAAKNVFFI